MWGSRKYPYPTMVGQWKFLRGGWFKGRNFQGVWGGWAREKISRRHKRRKSYYTNLR